MDAQALKNLGNARKQAGDLEGAAEHYRMALRAEPDYIPALYNLGLVLRATSRLDEAERCFRRVHELDPRDAEALTHLAELLSAGSRFAQAAEVCREALRLAPGNAYLWLQLAVASKALGDTSDAAAAYRRVIELEPDTAPAHNDLANLLQDEGRIEEAIVHYREAMRLAPDYAGAHSNLGCALARVDRAREAAACFAESIRLDPGYADAHLNLGSVRSLLGERDLALASFRAALELRPQDAAIRECVLTEMQHMCDWSRFEELSGLQRACAADPSQRVNPFSLLSIPSSAADQLQCARSHARQCSAAVPAGSTPLFQRRAPQAGQRLRVGYLSADFHEHATAYLAAELFELHDRSRFEVVAYSYGPNDRSGTRERLVRAFDRFSELHPYSHAEAARAISADAVDILVDLKGYTTHARTAIMALRPAPLQVSYLGYPGTMGAEFIDYLIADRFIVPPGSERFYSERLVFMPDTYQVNDRKRAVADTPARRALNLPEQGVVFCCFNQTYKILPETFAVWMRLLAAVPGSLLWLLAWNPWAVDNLRREARARGVDPGRLVFAPPLAADRHLGRLRAADLCLDTSPYNAHTTASDALWAGVPLVTRPGETFASRVAGSLLRAMDLPELIVGSMAEYEALAARLARDPALLAETRAKLGRNRASSPLFDTPRYVRNLESAYQRMWERHLRGKPPAQIDL